MKIGNWKWVMGLAAGVLLLAQVQTFGQSTVDGRITLEWDYAAADLAGTTFNVYHSTNIALPLGSWPLLASVAETNRIALTVTPGRNFFVCKATNFWGESDFSNVASTPGTPRSDVNLKVRKN